jgi:predicted exporter
MTKLLKFFSILIAALTLVIIYPTIQTETTFTLYNGQGLAINLFALLAMVLVAGVLVGIFYACSFFRPVQKKLKEYQRKLEKTSISSDEESSKVSVLKAKIATLEKALESALNKDE